MKRTQRKYTVSIGIPAYNEEKNIGHLLVSILHQELGNIVLEKIIIVSDGSTDNTVNAIRGFNDRRIELIVKKKRQGLNPTQNVIVRRASSDYLIILNADILLVDELFVQNIIRPMVKNKKIGVVGVNSRAARPLTLIERVLGNSHVLKTYIYKRLRNGDNIYMCYGVARAFSRTVYTKIRWPKNCPEDSYSYLFANSIGMQFHYERTARVIFRSPATIQDHIKQSGRFRNGRKVLEFIFGTDVVRKEFQIPLSLIVRSYLTLLPGRAFSLPLYPLIQMYVSFLTRRSKRFEDAHEIASSTKKVVSYSFVTSSLVDKL